MITVMAFILGIVIATLIGIIIWIKTEFKEFRREVYEDLDDTWARMDRIYIRKYDSTRNAPYKPYWMNFKEECEEIQKESTGTVTDSNRDSN